MKTIIKVSANRNGKSIEIVDYAIFIDSKPSDLVELKHMCTKPMIVSLYTDAVDQLKALPKSHFKNMSFESLVSETNRLIQIKSTLQALRQLNSGKCRSHGKSIAEKTKEDLDSVFSSIFYNVPTDALSLPEKCTLDVLSHSFAGQSVNEYDFDQEYSPLTDSDDAAMALLAAFDAFPFEAHMRESDAASIRTSVSTLWASHKALVATFRQFKAIAGDSIAHWTSQKFHSQGKKHGLQYHWTIGNWAYEFKQELIKSGAPLPEKKESSSQKIRQKYESSGQLSQAELISLFKTQGETPACEVVKHMTASTATSLLSMTTKNVQAKLVTQDYHGNKKPLKALVAIMERVANHSGQDAFDKLKTYFTEQGVSVVNWELLINHAGQYTNEEFMQWVSAHSGTYDSPLQHTQFENTFHTQVLCSLPSDKALHLHTSITHSFVAHMSTTDKQEFLNRYRSVPKVLAKFGKRGEYAKVSWSHTAELFSDLPYDDIKHFFTDTDGKLDEEVVAFLPQIIKAKDKAIAKSILMAGKCESDDANKLISFLDFNDKVEVLSEAKGYHSYEITHIFNNSDLKRFASIAISDQKLCVYLEQLLIKDIDSTIADSKPSHMCVPLTDAIARDIAKASILTVIKHGDFIQVNYGYFSAKEGLTLKQKLYARISRSEFNSAYSQSILEHPDYVALAHLMTANEIIKACDNREFLAANVDLVPRTYLEKFKNKEVFKNIVGDRRNARNDSLGCTIEKRLAEKCDADLALAA